jgi:hypothetical protein
MLWPRLFISLDRAATTDLSYDGGTLLSVGGRTVPAEIDFRCDARRNRVL